MTEISGKTAVVTGGGTGIGRAVAQALAHDGAAVVVADIMHDNAKACVAQITEAGGKAIAVHCDVCERDSIRAMKEEANRAFGAVQLLFANAGATSFEPLMEMSDDDVDWIMQVNLMGVMNTTRALLPDMMAAREGHVIATASMAGLLPGWIPVHVVYSAAKMGIIGMMMNLALEMEAYNVRTTVYCPGGVASGMAERNSLYRPARFGGPSQSEFRVPEASFKDNPVLMYPPEAIAPIVLRAVRNNRPFIFDHAEHRKDFRVSYADVVEACYDDIAEYEREQGRPEVVSTRGG